MRSSEFDSNALDDLAVRLQNYSKPITKTRKYENTKQDIKKEERPTMNKQTSNTEHSTAISVY